MKLSSLLSVFGCLLLVAGSHHVVARGLVYLTPGPAGNGGPRRALLPRDEATARMQDLHRTAEGGVLFTNRRDRNQVTDSMMTQLIAFLRMEPRARKKAVAPQGFTARSIEDTYGLVGVSSTVGHATDIGNGAFVRLVRNVIRIRVIHHADGTKETTQETIPALVAFADEYYDLAAQAIRNLGEDGGHNVADIRQEINNMGYFVDARWLEELFVADYEQYDQQQGTQNAPDPFVAFDSMEAVPPNRRKAPPMYGRAPLGNGNQGTVPATPAGPRGSAITGGGSAATPIVARGGGTTATRMVARRNAAIPMSRVRGAMTNATPLRPPPVETPAGGFRTPGPGHGAGGWTALVRRGAQAELRRRPRPSNARRNYFHERSLERRALQDDNHYRLLRDAMKNADYAMKDADYAMKSADKIQRDREQRENAFLAQIDAQEQEDDEQGAGGGTAWVPKGAQTKFRRQPRPSNARRNYFHERSLERRALLDDNHIGFLRTIHRDREQRENAFLAQLAEEEEEEDEQDDYVLEQDVNYPHLHLEQPLELDNDNMGNGVARMPDHGHEEDDGMERAAAVNAQLEFDRAMAMRLAKEDRGGTNSTENQDIHYDMERLSMRQGDGVPNRQLVEIAGPGGDSGRHTMHVTSAGNGNRNGNSNKKEDDDQKPAARNDNPEQDQQPRGDNSRRRGNSRGNNRRRSWVQQVFSSPLFRRRPVLEEDNSSPEAEPSNVNGCIPPLLRSPLFRRGPIVEAEDSPEAVPLDEGDMAPTADVPDGVAGAGDGVPDMLQDANVGNAGVGIVSHDLVPGDRIHEAPDGRDNEGFLLQSPMPDGQCFIQFPEDGMLEGLDRVEDEASSNSETLIYLTASEDGSDDDDDDDDHGHVDIPVDVGQAGEVLDALETPIVPQAGAWDDRMVQDNVNQVHQEHKEEGDTGVGNIGQAQADFAQIVEEPREGDTAGGAPRGKQERKQQELERREQDKQEEDENDDGNRDDADANDANAGNPNAVPIRSWDELPQGDSIEVGGVRATVVHSSRRGVTYIVVGENGIPEIAHGSTDDIGAVQKF